MKTKILATLQILAALTAPALAGAAWAGDSVTVPFSASVQSVLELGVEIREFKDGAVTNWGASSMSFGSLRSDAAQGPMRGEFYFDVYLHPNSSGRPYKLTQTASALTNGTRTIPAGACVVTPWPVDKNGQSYPSGAVIGTQGSFIASSKILYQSDPSGAYAPVAFTYAIANSSANGATELVPFDQMGGSYTSSVTFQVILTS